jgi:hypothetical protein
MNRMELLLAGTADGLHRVDEMAPAEFPGRRVSALAFDGAHLWAVADEHEIWGLPAGGRWERASSMSDRRANCLLPTEDGLLVGTSEAHLAQLEGGRLDPLESFEKVKGRSDWYTPWGGPPDVRSMSAGPMGIFVNVHVGGIPRSVDGGAKWGPTIDIDADVHQVLADTASGLVLAACAKGLAVSEDAGGSWDYRSDGMHADYCRAVAVAGDVVFVSSSTGPRGGRAAVYRAPLDGSTPFEPCTAGSPGWLRGNIDSHCLVAIGNEVAFGTEDGRVFTSPDRGESWEKAPVNLSPVECLAAK